MITYRLNNFCFNLYFYFFLHYSTRAAVLFNNLCII